MDKQKLTDNVGRKRQQLYGKKSCSSVVGGDHCDVYCLALLRQRVSKEEKRRQ